MSLRELSRLTEVFEGYDLNDNIIAFYFTQAEADAALKAGDIVRWESTFTDLRD